MSIENIIKSSIEVKQAVLNDKELLDNIVAAYEKIILMYKNGRKLLLCGNGGSAADAQHLAAEFSGRYYLDRPALNAEA
ncbi:MAG: SIS domain-containing protein, partial [Bacteroidales bacterium]